MGATVLQFRTASSEEAVTCYSCGVEFASPVLVRRRIDGESFYCPNGHSQQFMETKAMKLKKLLDAETRRREVAERDAEWQRSQAKTNLASATRAKNKLKKIETRVNAGVCPHCNRTFQQLARHMQCKHAEVAPVIQ